MNDTSPSSRVESLDPVLAAMLPRMNAASPPINLGAPSLRDAYREMLARLRPGAEPFTGRIIDGTVVAAGADVPIRTWIPEGASEHGDCVIYLHGGGWVMGDRESAAPAARALAERMKLRVVVVDYRLAPEHPFPAAFDDCLAVFRAERRRTNGWLGIAGDSAGANLARQWPSRQGTSMSDSMPSCCSIRLSTRLCPRTPTISMLKDIFSQEKRPDSIGRAISVVSGPRRSLEIGDWHPARSNRSMESLRPSSAPPAMILCGTKGTSMLLVSPPPEYRRFSYRRRVWPMGGSIRPTRSRAPSARSPR